MSAPVEQKAWLTRRLRAQAPASLSLNWRLITETRCPALPAALPPQTWCRGRRAAAGTPQSRYRRMQLKGGLQWRAESPVSHCRGRSKRLWKARSTMSTCPSPLVTSSSTSALDGVCHTHPLLSLATWDPHLAPCPLFITTLSASNHTWRFALHSHGAGGVRHWRAYSCVERSPLVWPATVNTGSEKRAQLPPPPSFLCTRRRRVDEVDP